MNISDFSFSIIVPTFNRADWLRSALRSIQLLRVPRECRAEVIVIDNCSTDYTAAVVMECQTSAAIQVRYVLEERQGASFARNRGIQEARYRHLVYLDDDMTVDAGWLEGYVEAQSALQADCVVGPVEPEFESPPEPWIPSSIIERLTARYSRRGDSPFLLPARRAHEIPGCNFAVLGSVAREVGGFDTRLGPSSDSQIRGEDFDFGRKLTLLGKRVAYVPQCRIRHFIGRTKTSPDGLRSRWYGNGATARAMASLEGTSPSVARLSRYHLRLVRLRLASLSLRRHGKRGEALRAELGAAYLKGYLYAAPSLAPRPWPPEPLA